MADPLVEKESITISMVAKDDQKKPLKKFFENDPIDHFSPIHRFKGFPWRLRVESTEQWHSVSIACEKSNEAELWECNALVQWKLCGPEGTRSGSKVHVFSSWGKQEIWLETCLAQGTVEVEISTNDDGESWRPIPILDSLAPRDGILVIGKEKKKLYVNKESLAAQSPFFDKLFREDKNQDEISIGDVEYEEFANMLKLLYHFDGASLTDENVYRMKELACQFELKNVSDKAVNYLLASDSLLSHQQKVLLSDQYKISFATATFLAPHMTNMVLKEFAASPEVEQMSVETVRILFKKSCDRA